MHVCLTIHGERASRHKDQALCPSRLQRRHVWANMGKSKIDLIKSDMRVIRGVKGHERADSESG